MFALVLKNSILMLLIIFIIHFMILNYAKEFTPSSINLTMTSFTNSVMSLNSVKKMKDNIQSNLSVLSENNTQNTDNVLNENNTDPNTTYNETCQNNDLIDLYNFVFQEDETSDNSQLDSYFPSDSYLKPKHMGVPCANQPKPGESTQFCLNEVDAFFKNNTKTKVPFNENNKSTSAGNHPIIFEYKEGDNDLNGYETYESSFMNF